MSYFRSYFEKNNTIIKDSQVNTAKNPTTQLYYGTGFSKFIFKIDLTDLQFKIDNGYLVVNENTRHYLKLTNTIFGNETFLGAPRGNGKERTNSFDLILFKISEDWDEGIGFDYEDEVFDYTIGNLTFDKRPSNWANRTTLDSWAISGIYSTSPDVIDTIHFDNGNENINIDITDYVNDILINGETNYGLGLAFGIEYQDIASEVDRSVAFFTKYTQTFFEPFVESVFDDVINDDRNNFIEKLQQNLYLYVTKGTNYYDLDVLPTVDILDNNGNVITGLSDLVTTKVKKGVYKVTFGINGITCDGKKFFYDKWKGIQVESIQLDDVTQKFIPKRYSEGLSIGANQTDTKRYVVQFSGIKQNEKIKRGEYRKIVVGFKSINDIKTVILDNAYYRIFIKEGKTEVIVHDWTPIDKTNENSFMLDTLIYIPREYWIEIKGIVNNEEIFYDDYIKFEIVSEK